MTTTDPSYQTSEGLLVSARDILREIETVLIHTGPETNREITRILTEAGNYGGHGNLIDQVQLRVLAIDDHLNNH